MVDDRRIIHEITPLMGKDVLYIADRHKKEFTYPIHNHSVYELNFVENAKGVRRIVGDSQEVIGDYDLCLITSPDLEHVWEQNECHSDDIREITVQFDFSMSDETLFGRNPYASITRMMQEAKKGLSFPLQAIMKVYGMLDTLSSVKDGFYAVQQFLTILYELSRCENARTLASSSYAKVTVEDDSRRILKVKNFISKNYMDELRLPELASLAGMSSSAFSRFFKLHTGRNISEYIIDLRLGYAARMLVDTAKSISEIGFDCGFNNLSNFNRIFKKKKGCSPSEFRESYHLYAFVRCPAHHLLYLGNIIITIRNLHTGRGCCDLYKSVFHIVLIDYLYKSMEKKRVFIQQQSTIIYVCHNDASPRPSQRCFLLTPNSQSSPRHSI